MTAVDVDALAEARAAATPGPWSSDATMILGPDEIQIVDCWESSADAALIVAAVNALPDVVAELRKLRALREAVEGLADAWDRLQPEDRNVHRYSAALADAAHILRAAVDES